MRVTGKRKNTTLCKFCRTPFETSGLNKVCPACDVSMEDKLKQVKEFLRENPGTTLPVVCARLNISSELIKFFLREERLEISGNASAFLTCDNCAKKITSGRLCDACDKLTPHERVNLMPASQNDLAAEREAARLNRHKPTVFKTK